MKQQKEAAGKKGLLVVSFGTSHEATRALTIEEIEKALARPYPEYRLYRAFTSQMIINILMERDGLMVDNVGQALSRMAADGVDTVLVQPTHVIKGFEYDGMMAALRQYRDQFARISCGLPLLGSVEDYDRLAGLLIKETETKAGPATAVVWLGHGSQHQANQAYRDLHQAFRRRGGDHQYIGTIEALPDLAMVQGELAGGGYRKVVLLPLMIVAGDHAANDMAGEDSWRTALEGEGYTVECVLQGLGQYAGVQQMLVEHAAAAADV